jgi:hypothetical protein
MPEAKRAAEEGGGRKFSMSNIQHSEALAKLRFARAVFSSQDSGFRMNSRITDFRPKHCEILTTDY